VPGRPHIATNSGCFGMRGWEMERSWSRTRRSEATSLFSWSSNQSRPARSIVGFIDRAIIVGLVDSSQEPLARMRFNQMSGTDE